MSGPFSDSLFDRALVPGWRRVILAKEPHKDINSPQIHDSRDSESWGERPGFILLVAMSHKTPRKTAADLKRLVIVYYHPETG